LPEPAPVAAAVTAAVVDEIDESTLGCAHDAAANPRAIATDLDEEGMRSPGSG
jgi:hypothetical protein